MKKYLFLPVILICSAVAAQIPEDVLRYSFFSQSGTARNQAIGGAMGSLGGDISATFINPAGLGNYKTGEFVFSPAMRLNNNNSTFRASASTNKQNNFNFLGGPLGLVYGTTDLNKPGSSEAISIAVTQSANYNNRVQYSGYNNLSSFSEQFAEQTATALNTQSLGDILNNPQYAYGAAPSLYTYLVDTFSGNTVKALPEFVLAEGKALYQQQTLETSGGLYEIALGYASNQKDKLLIGGSLGIPILNYQSSTTFNERDTSASLTNNFGSFTYTDHFTTKGAGVNLKLGVIYKPSPFVRLGFAVHTPSYFFTVKDRRNIDLVVNTENYKGIQRVSSDTFTNGIPGESSYSLATPWKALISGSYVIREIEDVTKQRGFITADIEYTRHSASSFQSANENPDASEQSYYKALNQVIKGQYKGSFNFKVGGELKFNVIMVRAGFAYYTNPYKETELKASKMLLSGGLGYRNKGFFIDLTYVYANNKDVNFPYRLADKANTFATLKNQRQNIVATVGWKF